MSQSNERTPRCRRWLAVMVAAVIAAPSVALAQAPPPTKPPTMPPTVEVELRDYWVETITREMALKRLAARTLDSKRREDIAQRIPPTTRHFLTTHGNAFLEYADFGEGYAHLVLLLRAQHKDGKVLVYGPPLGDGKVTSHVFETVNGRMSENGKVRETFSYSNSPVKLRVETAFLDPAIEIAEHPHGGGCCGACEWVHSALDLHSFDSWCCLGCCAQTE
jgi:hypothetical protein